jgi:xylulokinase
MKVITYDVGTTGLKSCLFDISKEEGIRFITGEVEEYSLNILPNGGVEQLPDEWWDAMRVTTKRLLEKADAPADDIKGISFCSQTQTVVIVDKDGAALRPSMSCMDTRASSQFQKYMQTGIKVEGLDIIKVLKFLKANGAVSASVKDPMWKYHWIRENEPELFEKAKKWLDAKEYLILRATGEIKASLDDVGMTFLYDIKKGRWSESLCGTFDIDMDKLPDVCKSTDTVGGLLPGAAEELGLRPGTPVIAGGNDVSLCQVGAGSLDIGDVNIYSGTSGWVTTTVDKLHLDLKHIIGSVIGADPDTYLYVAESETSGKCFEWVKDRLSHTPISTFEEMLDYVRDTPPGSNGVIFTPWMHGNRCPFEDPHARGMFFNIDVDNRSSDMIHAVIEGICMHKRWMLEATETSFKTNPVVRFTGGTAQSKSIAQTLAHVLGRQVETVENSRHIGAMGAAALIAVNFGIIDNIKDVKDVIKVTGKYTPDPDIHTIYNKIFPVFKELYKNTKDAYKKLNA